MAVTERGGELGGCCSLVVFKDVSCECRVLQRMVGLLIVPMRDVEVFVPREPQLGTQG